MKSNEDLRWKVGEIAEATGLTVRALHHYEAIGLVAPTERTKSGHRLYGPQALTQLYRVLTLRALGLPLARIRTLITSDPPPLRTILLEQLELISQRFQQHATLRDRIATVLGQLEHQEADSTAQVLPMIQEIVSWQLPVERKIAILIYADLAAAHEYLCTIFGFVPGTIASDDNGFAVHAVVYAGHNEFWLHPETPRFALRSPNQLGASTSTMAVMVEDVDEHYQRAVSQGANIHYEPVDQPYGFREYSASDHEGHFWSFMHALE